MTLRNAGEVSVLLVDDHAVVREGYRRLLERHREIVVIGEAGDAATAHALFTSLKPRIVVMDITLPGASGLEAMRRMLLDDANARVLIFSMHSDAIFVKRAMQTGAFGYVSKVSAPNVLIDAVLSIARGKKYLSPEIAQTIALGEGIAYSRGLTQREFDVLRLLIQGQSLQEIADALGLNSKTVANHQSTLRQKLGAETTIELLRKANELGLSS